MKLLRDLFVKPVLFFADMFGGKQWRLYCDKTGFFSEKMEHDAAIAAAKRRLDTYVVWARYEDR